MITFGLLVVAILPGFVIVQRYYSKDHLLLFGTKMEEGRGGRGKKL